MVAGLVAVVAGALVLALARTGRAAEGTVTDPARRTLTEEKAAR